MTVLPKAYQARRFTPAVENLIAETFDLRCNEDNSILPHETLVEQAKGSEIVFLTADYRVNAELVQALLPELSCIATLSVGVEHIDLDACKAAGVAVLHTPDVLSDAVGEIALMLLLATARRAREGDELVRSGRWTGWKPTQLLGHALSNQKVGILGLGRIGRAVASRSAVFGLEIHYHDRSPVEEELPYEAIYHESLDDMMRTCKYVIICAPGVPQLIKAVNAERIGLMPEEGIIINVSRGAIIDDDALIAALTHGRLFAAGLDVFDQEPDIDPRYRSLSNVFLTPHIGSATHEARDAMGFLLVQGWNDVANGKWPVNRAA